MRETMECRLIEVKGRLKEKEVQDILAEYMYRPDEEKIHRIIEQYRVDEKVMVLGYEVDNLIRGLIVLGLIDQERAVIKGIAVHKGSREQGIGRSMIQGAIKQFGFGEIIAETDDDAIAFYRQVGFEIEDLGEKYEGIRRYKCVLKKFK